MTPQPIRPLRILGIDPGLRRTGWGVIESEGNRLSFIGCGSVEPPDSLPLASRLLAIHQGLAAVLRDFARSIETAANLVVIKTPPGSAHLIGVALDQSDQSEIVGTICGDDTIFVACGSDAVAAALATRLRAESGKLH